MLCLRPRPAHSIPPTNIFCGILLAIATIIIPPSSSLLWEEIFEGQWPGNPQSEQISRFSSQTPLYRHQVSNIDVNYVYIIPNTSYRWKGAFTPQKTGYFTFMINSSFHSSTYIEGEKDDFSVRFSPSNLKQRTKKGGG